MPAPATPALCARARARARAPTAVGRRARFLTRAVVASAPLQSSGAPLGVSHFMDTPSIRQMLPKLEIKATRLEKHPEGQPRQRLVLTFRDGTEV